MGQVIESVEGVQIDGSNAVTPVLSTTGLKAGDRVTVMIKNHTAIVTGNITSPSTTAYDISLLIAALAQYLVDDTGALNSAQIIKDLNALLGDKAGMFKKIVADTLFVNGSLFASNVETALFVAREASIYGLLTAAEGEIATLKANRVDTTVLDAKIARIDELLANTATINDLYATYATVEELNAVDGKFGNLDSKYADIKLANVENADIGSLLAKVGLIDTTTMVNGHVTGFLDAVKINANNINTGTLTVDRLVISGNDKSILYELNKLGDLEASEFNRLEGGVIKERTITADHIVAGSITANEIHSGAITSDKILAGAVTASKISVTSLESIVAKIGSFAINNAIYSNDHSAYNTAKDGVYLGSDYISLGSGGKTWLKYDGSVSIGSGAITYDAVNDKVDIVADSIKMGSETVAKMSDIENISIGGRNFILGSRNLNGTGSTNYNGKLVLDNGFTAFKCTGDWHGVSYDAKKLILDSKVGDSFTYSVNIKTSDTCKLSFYAMCNTADGTRVYPDYETGQFNSASIVTTNAEEEQDQRVHITFSVTQGWVDLINDGGTIKWTLQVYDGASSDNPAYLYAPKLERGNKVTDWTPAPEDAETNTNDLSTRVSTNESSIAQLSDKIVLNVTDITNLGTRMSTVEQTATGLTARITNTENGIIDASKTATNYLNVSSNGLIVGDLTASTLGKNILIDNDSVDIRSGTNVRASFGEDYLYLAKHSRNAKIDLCNGLVELRHESKYSYDTVFVIDTPNATEIQGTYNPLCVTSTVSGKVAIQFANTSGVLGSIGMVASGTESYITRNHPSTAATYSILDTGNFYKLMDSGWLTCAINTSGDFTVYSDADNIRYRKIGKMVEVVGAVKPKKALDGGTTNYVFATLPSGYRPSYAITERAQGSGGHSWLFSITAAGELRYSRYSDGSSCVDLPAATWLPFHTTFFVD
ncbi:MAG: hypothetical protein J6Q84_07300 [Kiritimatiellae bacterium]|nr:hypothetical protein [Kiritimatiellia bacterium]